MLTKQIVHDLMMLDLNKQVSSYLGVPEKSFKPMPNYNSYNAAGYTIHDEDTDDYSIYISKYVKDSMLKTVIPHELCHLYSSDITQHGEEWQRLANDIGKHFKVDITTRSTISNMDYSKSTRKPVALLTCPKCGNAIYIWNKNSDIYRTKGKNIRCADCKFDFVFKDLT